ncbi:unnamed protein product [Caenorhabditis bovis]|uniref:Uncharacterized protein n=1 Tax=Caenorhabditis bovis TaxID=2654633 RepID=A0A8S1EZR3_9PELO|nr:unnamed protein product [Caenorhabditis bovis]
MSLLIAILLVLSGARAADGSSSLLFAQVLFRHGARAPSAAFTNATYAQHFPRGLGELTDRGFENSHRLGRLLAKRYVSTGFLDAKMVSKQMYWRSVNLARCLSSAATVGAAMFRDYGRHLHVPVNTQETGEHLLNYDFSRCHREVEIIREQCPHYGTPDDFDSWPHYEEFVYNCLNISSPLLKNRNFRQIEAHLNEYKNGLKLPDEWADNVDELIDIHTAVTHWITGTGRYHDPRKMRIKFGNMMNTLIENMEKAWKSHAEKRAFRKFNAYSTQDWMLLGILDSFGVLDETLGMRRTPDYNSMIILELWDDGVVRMLYKRDERDETLIDVSRRIRECGGDVCRIERLSECCRLYRERTPGASCVPLRPRDFLNANRRRRFVGPE